MKKVLIISYAFPPMAAVGGQRAVKLCKFLPQYGWSPVVLTVKGGSNMSWDESSMKEIADAVVYRSFVFEPLAMFSRDEPASIASFDPTAAKTDQQTNVIKPSWWKRIKRYIRQLMTVPDDTVFWTFTGLWKGIRAIRKEKVSVILSTSPPASTHLLASILSRLTGVPHIVDFRDLWTLNHTYRYNNYSKGVKKFDAWMERFVLNRAAGIVTASPGFTSQMKNHMNGSLQSKLTTITNGFDYDAVNMNEEWLLPDQKVLRFIYAGSLYSDFNPIFLLDVFAEWIHRRNIDKSTLQMDFYGNSEYDYSIWSEQLGLEDVVSFHGFKPRSYVLSQEKIADVLILLLGFNQESRNVIPAKFFEYLASGCTILALVPDGVLARQIEKYDAGHFLCQPDREGLIRMFQEIYDQWHLDRAKKRRFRYIEDIDRRKLASRMAELLNEVTVK